MNRVKGKNKSSLLKANRKRKDWNYPSCEKNERTNNDQDSKIKSVNDRNNVNIIG